MDKKNIGSNYLDRASKGINLLFSGRLSKAAASAAFFMMLNFGGFAQGKYFGTDISKHNAFDLEGFIERNRNKWDDAREDVIGVSFVYIRTSHQDKTDPQCLNHFNKIKKYNNNDKVKANEKIAVGCYHYFGHTKTNVQSQIDVFMKQYNNINKDGDGVVDLIPMLDIEHLPSNLNNKSKNNIRDKALEWLNGVEKESGTTPGVYINASDYYNLIYGDKRFDKYKLWLAAYSTDRVNQETGEVMIGPRNQKIRIIPTKYQFGEGGAIGGLGARHGRADMNNTHNITELMIRNNDYREDAEEKSDILDFTYHRISFDKTTNTAYKVYSYIIKNYGKNEHVLNRFAKNGGNTTEAIVTDESGNEYSPDITHKQSTKVYIKEKIQPGDYGSKFVYTGITTINKKQHFTYIYTIGSKGNYGGVLKQLQDTGLTIDQNILVTDINGKEYARDQGIDQFTKDQKVYVQIPVDYQPVK